jgi:hypothetical protein
MAEALARAGVRRIYGIEMAQSMGIKGVRVEAPQDVRTAVQ